MPRKLSLLTYAFPGNSSTDLVFTSNTIIIGPAPSFSFLSSLLRAFPNHGAYTFLPPSSFLLPSTETVLDTRTHRIRKAALSCARPHNRADRITQMCGGGAGDPGRPFDLFLSSLSLRLFLEKESAAAIKMSWELDGFLPALSPSAILIIK